MAGSNNYARCYSIVVGGSNNTGSLNYSFIGGGYSNSVTESSEGNGGTGVIVGGDNNLISTYNTCYGNFIGGGSLNCITQQTQFSSILGGYCNLVYNTCKSGIQGGSSNKICYANDSSIVGGNGSCITGLSSCSFIGGGAANSIRSSTTYGVIGGGSLNSITNCKSYNAAIAGGNSNQINDSCYSFIGAGQTNCILNSRASGILAGFCNTISSRLHSFVVGCAISATSDCTTYMNNATVACHLQVGGTTTLNSTTGRIDATNDVIAFATSDRRLKECITVIEGALDKVKQLNGVTFKWKPLTKEEIQTIHGNTGKDVGVIAQEVEEVLAEAVTTRDNGYKAVNYEKIVPLLIEAIKEQQKQIDELKSKL